MFNSILEKLRIPAQSQQPSSFRPPGLDDPGRPDQEEDGFLLVGETMSERNTILPTHHPSNSYGCPPTYSQVCSLKVQHSADNTFQPSSSGVWSSHLPSSQPSASQPATSTERDDSQTSHSTTYANLVTKDIPFRLSEELHFAHKLTTDISYYAVPRLRAYDPTKFLYDFEEERRVLRDMADSSDG